MEFTKEELKELHDLLEHEWLEAKKSHGKLMRKRKWDPKARLKSEERCIFLTNLFKKIKVKWQENKTLTP